MQRLSLFPILWLALCYSSIAQITERQFIFGHSLINHEFQVNITPSQETSVPHWMHYLAQEANHNYAVSGQYGFLPQHINVPPIAQWGFDVVAPAWDSDTQAFSEADFTNILITPGNFIQDVSPLTNYIGETFSPVDATETIFDWCIAQEPDLNFYIYENWPDMGGFLGAGFPPSQTEWENYNNYLNSDFHSWFLDYHDNVLARVNNACVKMIPVGPIISSLVSQAPYNQIPITTLYEDDAPHGRPTTYFLAALITYMAIYQEQAPLSYTVDTNFIDPIIANNYADVVDFIWTELNNFNFPDGTSRVFCALILPAELTDFTGQVNNNNIQLTWNTTSERNHERFDVELSINGIDFEKVAEVPANGNTEETTGYRFELPNVDAGTYYFRLKQIARSGQFDYSEIIKVVVTPSEKTHILFPNPTNQPSVNLNYFAENNGDLSIAIVDVMGRVIQENNYATSTGNNSLSVPIEALSPGYYFLLIRDKENTKTSILVKQ